MLMATEIKQVFRMKEGTDETSYAKTSYIQSQVLSMSKPIKEKALRDFYNKEQPPTICIADLGCSSAESSTVNLIYEFIDIVDNARRELGNNRPNPQEYQVYLNDLPGNDFNTLFRSMGNFESMLKHKLKDDFGHCFVNGVPGSFYGRLFPSNHLHFVHSSYSLHWLSQIPEGIEENKEDVWLGSKSPPNVVKAYHDQHKHDFLTFLRCRSKEVAVGGAMVLTMIGRTSTDLYGKESSKVFDSLATALHDLVSEGLIEEENLNTFKFPYYTPTTKELEFCVEKEGSFTINQVEVTEVNWETTIQFENSCISFNHIDFAKCMRAVMEPFVINHFGEAIVEELFRRFTGILKVSMAKDEKNMFINITIWVTRKAQSNDVTENI